MRALIDLFYWAVNLFNLAVIWSVALLVIFVVGFILWHVIEAFFFPPLNVLDTFNRGQEREAIEESITADVVGRHPYQWTVRAEWEVMQSESASDEITHVTCYGRNVGSRTMDGNKFDAWITSDKRAKHVDSDSGVRKSASGHLRALDGDYMIKSGEYFQCVDDERRSPGLVLGPHDRTDPWEVSQFQVKAQKGALDFPPKFDDEEFWRIIYPVESSEENSIQLFRR